MFRYCTPKNLTDLKSETFPDGKRYYTLEDGTRLPSVTTVIGAQKKQAIMEWRRRVGEQEANRISKKATSRGTRVHSIAEEYLKNNPDYIKDVFPDAKSMFLSIKPLIDKNVQDIYYQETALYSLTLGMAGRVDLIAHWNGILSVIDFKTSNKIKTKDQITDYFAQCAAYSCMHEELIGIPVNQIVILMAVENEKPLVFIEKTEDHIHNLVEAINFYKNHA
jgi:genome maintenance exonuclease 1